MTLKSRVHLDNSHLSHLSVSFLNCKGRNCVYGVYECKFLLFYAWLWIPASFCSPVQLTTWLFCESYRNGKWVSVLYRKCEVENAMRKWVKWKDSVWGDLVLRGTLCTTPGSVLTYLNLNHPPHFTPQHWQTATSVNPDLILLLCRLSLCCCHSAWWDSSQPAYWPPVISKLIQIMTPKND